MNILTSVADELITLEFCDLKRQTDKAEKTIILHQDEIMAALKSIQGSTIFTTATKSKKMMSDLNCQCHVKDITRNLFCGCNVVIVNVYLSYDLFIIIINPC
jgi:hypothetical protein